MAMFGSDVIHLKGAGALAILVMAFTAGVGWRRQGWGDENPVSEYLARMWIVFQPLLFSLIGAEIQVDKNLLIFQFLIFTLQVQEMSLSTVLWGSLILLSGSEIIGAETYLKLIFSAFFTSIEDN